MAEPDEASFVLVSFSAQTGISDFGQSLNWINNKLTGKEQRVVIKGVHSDWYNVLNDIAQRSALDTRLSINMKCIDRHINNVMLKFADDTKSFVKVKDMDATESLRADHQLFA